METLPTVCDVNFYRAKVHGKTLEEVVALAADLRRSETGKGVFALAAATVVEELLVHVSDPEDLAYRDCSLGLHLLRRHCEGDQFLIPEFGSQLSQAVFNADPHAELNERLVLAADLSLRDGDQPSAELRALAGVVRQNVEFREKEFLEGVVNDIAGNATNEAERKAARTFFRADAGLTLARVLSFVTFKLNGIDPSASDIEKLAGEIRKNSGASLKLFELLIEKALGPEINFANPKRNRGNYLWDLQVSFLVGHFRVVTNDKDVVKAATAAGLGDFVMTQANYLSFLAAD
jgi:hypothetical protein